MSSRQVEKHTAPADGAFYVYADLRHYGVHDTPQWCAKLLDDAGLALTPGSDFEFDQETGNSHEAAPEKVLFCGFLSSQAPQNTNLVLSSSFFSFILDNKLVTVHKIRSK